ncbi:hypothetical protein U0070_026532 [Myodes glareolus]|uniref:Uncharacterized protein n=1 Tax=Myodes glareolus TaxID=447135 RepID=A0AAW0I6P0_MYOGA
MRPKPGTSTGAHPSQKHPQKQAQANNLHGNKSEPVTFTGKGSSQLLLLEKSRASAIFRSRYEGVTTKGAGPSQKPAQSQGPPQEQTQASNLYQSIPNDHLRSRPKPAVNSMEQDLSQRPQQEEAQASNLCGSRPEQLSGMQSDLQGSVRLQLTEESMNMNTASPKAQNIFLVHPCYWTLRLRELYFWKSAASPPHPPGRLQEKTRKLRELREWKASEPEMAAVSAPRLQLPRHSGSYTGSGPEYISQVPSEVGCGHIPPAEIPAASVETGSLMRRLKVCATTIRPRIV